MGLKTVIRTHVGLRRKVNEDSVLAQPDRGVWVVADGMGGHDAGDVASAMVTHALSGAASAGVVLDGRVEDARLRLDEVNAQLITLAALGGAQRTIGSTVAALLLGDEGFACLWAGDSRAYLARDGQLVQLTRDHSLVQELVDLGEVAPEDARDHPNANVITRAVGAGPKLELDVARGEVRPRDVFLLASDGLTRLAGDEELLDALQAQDLERAADELVALCLERGAPDNLSFVLLRSAPD